MKFDLENKTVLVTGAAGGIGSAICKKFNDANCILICTTSKEEKLNELKKKYGNKNFYYCLDLINKTNYEKELDRIITNHKIDILINNAGITRDNLFLRMSEEQWEDVIKINLSSNYYLIKKILPSMIKNRSGSIIGISSVVALTGNPGQANYTASKSAMISMYKSLAQEVAQRNININIIAPGFIESPMTQKLNESQVKNILDKIPMKRLGKPEDIANIALFLSSEKASYITGQTFHINGGMLMV